MINPKIRIQLLDADHRVISDRCVDQYTELLNGPSEPHDGPVRIEAVLIDSETTDRFKEYLDKLRSRLPSSVPKTKSLVERVKNENEYHEIYQLCEDRQTIDQVINLLHDYNFRFISSQYLVDFNIEVSLPKEIPKDVQLMTKVVRYAKDPRNDKFDFDMTVFVKFMGEGLQAQAYFVHRGKLEAKLDKPGIRVASDLKNIKMPTVFPSYMDIEERLQWRLLRRKIENGTELEGKKLKFYERWAKEIQNISLHEGVPLL